MNTDYLPAINLKSLERREKYNYIVVPQLPDEHSLDEACIVGSYTLIGLESLTRWILRSKAIPLECGLESPSSIARDYLKLKFGRSPRATKAQIKSVSYGLKVGPNYAKPARFTEGYYLDITATYYTLVNQLGWNLDYWPSRWLIKGEDCLDFPFPESKAARNCLVSLCISSTAPLYLPPNRLHMESDFRIRNNIINLQLWRAINDILFAIAFEMRQAGVSYIYTDGYIAKDYATFSRACEVLDSWGLPYKIKHSGGGRITGFGGYEFDGQRPNLREGEERTFNNLFKVPYHAWLKRAFLA